MDTTDAPQIIEHVHKAVAYTPYDTRWVPFSARFVSMGILPNSKGALNVFQLNNGELEPLLEGKTANGIKCGTFSASSVEERFIATGDHAGKLVVYDLDHIDKPVFSQQAHASIINAIDGCGGLDGGGGGAPEIVTAGRDGCVRLWDTRVPQPVLALEPEEGQPARDCWTVAFGNAYKEEERVIAAGYDNGDVKLFDLRTNTMRFETNVSNGVTCIDFDRKDIEMNKLVVTTLESKFRLFDLRTQHPSEGFACLSERAHKATVWVARHLPQNRDIFMTGGGNGGFNLYKYHYPKSRTALAKDNVPVGVVGSVELLNSKVLSSQPVVSMDWSPDKEGLCVLSCLDQTIRSYIVTKLNKY
jgi:WD repeat-containing protein 92